MATIKLTHTVADNPNRYARTDVLDRTALIVNHANVRLDEKARQEASAVLAAAALNAKGTGPVVLYTRNAAMAREVALAHDDRAGSVYWMGHGAPPSTASPRQRSFPWPRWSVIEAAADMAAAEHIGAAIVRALDPGGNRQSMRTGPKLARHMLPLVIEAQHRSNGTVAQALNKLAVIAQTPPGFNAVLNAYRQHFDFVESRRDYGTAVAQGYTTEEARREAAHVLQQFLQPFMYLEAQERALHTFDIATFIKTKDLLIICGTEQEAAVNKETAIVDAMLSCVFRAAREQPATVSGRRPVTMILDGYLEGLSLQHTQQNLSRAAQNDVLVVATPRPKAMIGRERNLLFAETAGTWMNGDGVPGETLRCAFLDAPLRQSTQVPTATPGEEQWTLRENVRGSVRETSFAPASLDAVAALNSSSMFRSLAAMRTIDTSTMPGSGRRIVVTPPS